MAENHFQIMMLKVQVMETCASVNVGEFILNLPHNYSKSNNGYGTNVGDCMTVPSSGLLYDPDLIDTPMISKP